MAKRRGFFAELNHQHQVALKRQEQAARATARAHASAQRQAEQAARAAERTRSQMAKASAAELKQMEQEAARLHYEAQAAEVESRNTELAEVYAQIDGILAATLTVDDYVDLERLRQVASHPPFDPGAAGAPALRPPHPLAPPEPQFIAPPGEPKGLGGVFGGKKKYESLLAEARAVFDAQHRAWQAEMAALPGRVAQIDAAYDEAERRRLTQLAEARARYEEECAVREREAAEANAELDQLIANLGYGVEDAMQEYVAIVLGNSVYPERFPVRHQFTYDSSLQELTLKVSVPAPAMVPAVKEYKYVKARDEIAETALSQKEQKDRYAGAVAQVALRTLHEVFEADRVGRVQTISLTVATEALDTATGRMVDVPLVAVATSRAQFSQIELANVVPAATLTHLNAQMSKNPWGLVAIDTSAGVRG